MAIMIPETVPSKSSQGEKDLFAILRDRLDESFIVWHNPNVGGLEADFILLSPTFGLLIIEVKAYNYGNILQANQNFFQIRRTFKGVTTVESETSPLKQCRSYLINTFDIFKRFPILRHASGDRQGKLVMPIGHGALMSNIKMSQVSEDAGLLGVLTPPRVAFRDELLAWKELNSTELVSRLRQMFTVYFSFKTLTEDQVSTIRGILYPEFVAKEQPATTSSTTDEVILPKECKVLKTLDIEQERLARSIGEGHRLFSGVAGSGKTIILLARAKFLVNRDSDSRVLVLCYNITLAAYLRSLLHQDSSNPQYKKIEVHHFHDWAKNILGRLPHPDNVAGNYNIHMGNQLLEKISASHESRKWDSILVDEAHTFFPEWLECCVQALKDSENGSLTVVSDGSQSLYERTKFTWKSVGIQATGRSKKLSRNYRNTKQILSAAWNVIEASSLLSDESGVEAEATFPIIKPSSALRSGTKPLLSIVRSSKDEIEGLLERIKQLLDKGYQTKDIAIIYQKIDNYYRQSFNLLTDRLKQEDIDYYWITQSKHQKANYNDKLSGVRIITSLSALGLEFKAVIIPWVQQFDNSYYTANAESIIRNKRQLYVAMTRAQQELYIFGSGSKSILGMLKDSSYFDVC